MVRYILSLSGGKDSAASLLYLIEHRMPLDEAVFYDTGMEFDCVRQVIYTQLAPLLAANGIKLTTLHPKNPFMWDMLERPILAKDGSAKTGRKWCGGPCRWGTNEKISSIRRYCKSLCDNGDTVHQYVGIAADEEKRLLRLEPDKSSPIAEAGLTEKDCLQICRNHGLSWLENGYDLYDHLDRLSCFCCRNKNLGELRFMYTQLPEYWNRLRYMQMRMPDMPMKPYGSVFDLEKRFEAEKTRAA